MFIFTRRLPLQPMYLSDGSMGWIGRQSLQEKRLPLQFIQSCVGSHVEKRKKLIQVSSDLRVRTN
jgi:hypothetical protein